MNGVADQIMPAVTKSSSLRELYIGDNPWKDEEWKYIVNVYVKPSKLNVLGLGAHTYLTAECVSVIISPEKMRDSASTLWFMIFS